jgi:pimeloyl-ACP methyl ester carboxylesterase
VRAHWCLPRSFRAMADYLETLPGNAAGVRLPESIPTILLTADGQCESIPGAIHRSAPHCGHWMQLDDPDLVAAAIRELIDGI